MLNWVITVRAHGVSEFLTYRIDNHCRAAAGANSNVGLFQPIKVEKRRHNPVIRRQYLDHQLTGANLARIQFEIHLCPGQAPSPTAIEGLTQDFLWFNYMFLCDTELKLTPEIFPAVEDVAFAIGVDVRWGRTTRR